MNGTVHRSRSLVLMLLMLLQACSFGGGRVGSASDNSSTSDVAGGASPSPVPVAAWSLQGDGGDRIGPADLNFVGGYDLTTRGVAFDGVTGGAVTPAPGPLDTTRSLTLSAWVTYVDQLTDVPIAVSQALYSTAGPWVRPRPRNRSPRVDH